MLANPVALPAYATPAVWFCAFLAAWAEIHTETAMLRRSGWGRDVRGALLKMNVITWLAFLICAEVLAMRRLPLPWVITLLEACVIVLEAAWIWLALRRRAGRGAGPWISPLRAFAVAIVGNLVSILVSIALPNAFSWVLGPGLLV